MEYLETLNWVLWIILTLIASLFYSFSLHLLIKKINVLNIVIKKYQENKCSKYCLSKSMMNGNRKYSDLCWPGKRPSSFGRVLWLLLFSSRGLRPVVPGGSRGAMAPPEFGRWVNPFSTRGRRLCSPNDTGTPGFSDLPTALGPTAQRRNDASILFHMSLTTTADHYFPQGVC